MKKIYFITGASGVGKTTLVEQLKKKHIDKKWVFLHFDSIGVPSIEEMIKEYGSPSGWQEAMTYKWINELIYNYDNEVIVFEGQVNLQFILDGFKRYSFTNYKAILIDCSEEEMTYRLTYKRNQPELLTDDMRNWLKFLRHQARELGIPIIDTSNLTNAEIIVKFEEIINI